MTNFVRTPSWIFPSVSANSTCLYRKEAEHVLVTFQIFCSHTLAAEHFPRGAAIDTNVSVHLGRVNVSPRIQECVQNPPYNAMGKLSQFR